MRRAPQPDSTQDVCNIPITKEKEYEMSVTGQFEVEAGLPASLLTGTIQADAFEPGEPPTRIFDINDLVEVKVDWTLTGSLARMICGTWQADLYLESIGRGKEFEVEGCTVPLNPAGNGQYTCNIKIPSGTIKPDVGETDIVYKMVVTVTYKDPGGHPGPIAGFVELPIVQFYLDA
jgi:hypothetical protein